MARNLDEILRGGYCTRWHANPDLAHIRETLAEHHARVAQILLALHPAPSLALIDAALHHDAGEPGLGDLSALAKRADPVLALHCEAAEKENLDALGLDFSALSNLDRKWIKFADMLAAYMHVQHVAPYLLADPAWQAAADRLTAHAEALGVTVADLAKDDPEGGA